MKYILLFLIVPYALLASAEQTNLNIIEKSLDSLMAKTVPFAIGGKILIEEKDPFLKLMIEKSILKIDSTVKFTDRTKATSIIRIDSIAIVYDEATNERVITVSTNLNFKADDHFVDFPFAHTAKDNIDFDNISKLEDESLDFTKGTLRKEETSFWEDALEPAVYVVSAAAVIYLLFTIRSK